CCVSRRDIALGFSGKGPHRSDREQTKSECRCVNHAHEIPPFKTWCKRVVFTTTVLHRKGGLKVLGLSIYRDATRSRRLSDRMKLQIAAFHESGFGTKQ